MSKTITRKYIQRITKREGNTNIRQISGGGGGGGGASQYWVDENYISKLFFNQLFTVYDEDGNIVEPNDTESVIASIKSMFGFWTDAYLSALGNGEGGGAELTLASLADVDVHGVANGQALVYDAYTQKWVPGQAGLDPTSLWQELGSLGTEQISSTHLTTALSTYNPTNNFKTINGNSIIGTGDINVGGGGGSYLPLSGGTLSGTLTISTSGTGSFNQGIRINRVDTNKWATLLIGKSGNSTSGTGSSTVGDGAWLIATPESSNSLIFNLNDARESVGLCLKGHGNSDMKWNGNTVWHAGNFSPSSYLPLSGGTLTGELINSLNGYCYSWGPDGRYRLGCNTDTNFYLVDEGFRFNKANADFLIKIGRTNAIKISSKGYFFSDTIFGYNIDSSSSSSYCWGMYQWQDNFTFTRRNTSDTWLGDAVTISLSNGYVGIGTSPSYRLHVDGVAYASTGFYSAGYVTALSDIRHKDVKGNVGLTVSEVANAPSVKFLWKDRRQDGMQVGSIAQYWQKVMPEAIVKNADGELTMSYGVIALLASIATARKVEDHERRIAELERENKKLKQQLNAA